MATVRPPAHPLVRAAADDVESGLGEGDRRRQARKARSRRPARRRRARRNLRLFIVEGPIGCALIAPVRGDRMGRRRALDFDKAEAARSSRRSRRRRMHRADKAGRACRSRSGRFAWPRRRDFSVHVFTASGGAVAVLALYAAIERNFAGLFRLARACAFHRRHRRHAGARGEGARNGRHRSTARFSIWWSISSPMCSSRSWLSGGRT